MNSKLKEFNVVGIGASAGGLKALQNLFRYIPDDTGMSFIIVQHLSPDFKSLMPELLSKFTNMTIHTAKDKLPIKPNCIYLNQRNKNLHIKGSKIYLLEKGPKNNLNLPIDIFFHTLGEEFKEKSIAIILSGTGSDGSRGITTVKEKGGITIAQNPEEAEFDGMPNAAINTNAVDYIKSTQQIAKILTSKNIELKILNALDLNTQKLETEFKGILVEIYKHCGVDFREYKKNTIIRRMEKRMGINNINNIKSYSEFVKKTTKKKKHSEMIF
ncbi:chemotaxis protein CheB [Psychroserpens damuponensis]|uniref:chemotaxis protein CheB n=1 Tax=Psychroserpens damuponensis TaxID=943936 RepID=UPI0006941CF9|nr:chemotaxis protein CheB [Psychroserpens damuponensis]